MSDYSNTFGGAAKDTAGSTIIAADHDTEYDALATHIATKTDKIAAATNNNLVTMDASGNIKDSGTDLTALAVGSVTATGDIILPEKANHSSTPSAGNGYIWVRSDTPNALVYTDDDGTDYELISKTGTATATTSGTTHDYTGIPSTVKRITVMLSGVSQNGILGGIEIRLGDSGGIESTGYVGSVGRISATSPDSDLETSGFSLTNDLTGGVTLNGHVIITLLNSSTNTWVCSGVIGRGDSPGVWMTAGAKALSGTLTQIQLVATVGTFDAGEFNIMYE